MGTVAGRTRAGRTPRTTRCQEETCGIPSARCLLKKGHTGRHYAEWRCCYKEYECRWMKSKERC